jgi:uncharacterized protein (DUF2147 family)
MEILMKRSAAMLGLAAAFGFAGTAYAGAEDALGTWRDVEKGATFKIYTCDGGVCAQIVKPVEADAKDANNPDLALRGRPIAGVIIMNGAAKSGDNAWKGKLYNPEDGKTYSGSITVVNKNEVKLEGCVLVICKSKRWVRAE